MLHQSFDNFFLHRNQWDCIHKSSVKLCILKGGHSQGLLSPKPLTAIFGWKINQLSVTAQQTKLPWQLMLGFICNPHTQFNLGGKSHPTLPLQVLLQAPDSDHPHTMQWPATPCSYQSQPTSTQVMQVWADINRALNLKLEYGWSEPGIFAHFPRERQSCQLFVLLWGMW